ncbi:MAG: MBL fold metallo-hydrolase [Candidatus Babeliaceae bacterium]
MHITFLGTRGGIIARSPQHFMQSSTLITHYTTRIVIDCGIDWLTKIHTLKLDALFITHAHPDHVGGLRNGAQCPVYAIEETEQAIKKYPLNVHLIKPYQAIKIGSLTLIPFPVEHSIHVPAVGYRINSTTKAIFYVPDVVALKEQHQALYEADVYIGDGAIITRTLLTRTKDHTPWGHAPIEQQLKWCQQEKVPRAIFTHCGSEIVKHDEQYVNEKIAFLEKKYRIKTEIAYDGLTIKI